MIELSKSLLLSLALSGRRGRMSVALELNEASYLWISRRPHPDRLIMKGRDGEGRPYLSEHVIKGESDNLASRSISSADNLASWLISSHPQRIPRWCMAWDDVTCAISDDIGTSGDQRKVCESLFNDVIICNDLILTQRLVILFKYDPILCNYTARSSSLWRTVTRCLTISPDTNYPRVLSNESAIRPSIQNSVFYMDLGKWDYLIWLSTADSVWIAFGCTYSQNGRGCEWMVFENCHMAVHNRKEWDRVASWRASWIAFNKNIHWPRQSHPQVAAFERVTNYSFFLYSC